MDERVNGGQRRTEDPQEVLGLLRAQESVYARLERCAGRQRSLITQDDPAPLLSLLAERQKLAAELAELGARLDPVRKAWETHRRHFSTAQRNEAERLLDGIAARLRRLLDNDAEDARLLSARRQGLAQAMRATHSVGQALSAYRPIGGHPDNPTRVDEAG